MRSRKLITLALAGALLAGTTLGTVSCTPEPAPKATAKPTASQTPQPLQRKLVGQGWNVTVNSVSPNATDVVMKANSFNPAPETGQVYALVNITLERTAKTAGYPFDVEVNLRPSSGVDVSPAAAAAPQRVDMLTQMQPGATATGNIAFLVPATSEKLVVAVTPGDRAPVTLVEG
jgi:hypothetical protein